MNSKIPPHVEKTIHEVLKHPDRAIRRVSRRMPQKYGRKLRRIARRMGLGTSYDLRSSDMGEGSVLLK